jgi:hypothetical protein
MIGSFVNIFHAAVAEKKKCSSNQLETCFQKRKEQTDKKGAGLEIRI